MRDSHERGQVERFAESDIAFHQTLFDAVGNVYLDALFEPLSEVLHRLRTRTSSVLDIREDALSWHTEVLEAAVARDAAGARAAMHGHLVQTEDDMMSYLGGRPMEIGTGASRDVRRVPLRAGGGGVTPGQRLRDLLAGGGTAQLPAVYDGVTARAAETAGFPAVFVTGNGVAASLLGRPDVGLVTMTESVGVARSLAAAVSVPVLHDGDSGYGGVLQVVRLVRELEAAGVAGLTLEDQETPKRCGLLAVPAPVVEEGEWLAKVSAAVDARSGDTVVVARTDALRSQGLEAAVRRAGAAAVRGADAVLVVGLAEPGDVAHVASRVEAPLVVLVGDAGPLADLAPDGLAALGVAVAVYPSTVRSATAWAALAALRALRRDGTSAAVRGRLLGQAEWDALVGLEEALEQERRWN